MSSAKEKTNMMEKNVLQAVVILDTFQSEFRPISDDLPIALLPLVDKPLVEYTLEYLSSAGVEETFLFCCSHIEAIKTHLKKCIEETRIWSLKMKVSILASETCCSFGDCLRDIDAKGILRSDFILLEPGVISNIKLLPLLEEHAKTAKQDKGASMTLVLQETTSERVSNCPQEEMILATNNSRKILSHKKLGLSKDGKVEFPLEIFIENSTVSLYYNLRDTGISICSPSVLPLFADNFDFQTKDDFVRGLLMNEEILESTLYCHIIKSNEFGNSINSWRKYQILTWEFLSFCSYPISPAVHMNRQIKNDVINNGSKVPKSCTVRKSVIGKDVTIGENVKIEDSFIFSNVRVEDNVTISKSIIGENCVIEANCLITSNTVLGKGVVIESNKKVDDKLVTATEGEDDTVEKLGNNAFIILEDDEDLEEEEIQEHLTKKLYKTCNENITYESEEFSNSDDEELSCTYSPAPDDTKLFFTEVIDSLTRGYEDKLLCDNLILEVNSSRYAYNVTVREVNFNVIKAILLMTLKDSSPDKIVPNLGSILNYFSPMITNYIRNRDAMIDCLDAIEDVGTSEENVTGKWVVFALKWLYDKDHLGEDSILKWYNGFSEKSKLRSQVQPFADWLNEAEESSSEEETSLEE